MALDQELQNAFYQLLHADVVQITLSGVPISMRLADQSSKLALSTSIYQGSNFIPKSVRLCLAKKFAFGDGTIRTYITVDENRFRVQLNYLGSMSSFDHQSFKHLIKEFDGISEEWRYLLEEHDRNDLIHVTIPRQ